MNLKKLEKAVKILERVKHIDKEIIELDKFAVLVANGEVKTSLAMSVEKKDADEVPNSVSDSLDQMHEQLTSIFSYGFHRGMTEPSKPRRNKHSISADLTETITLNVLAVLLADKYDKRTALLNQIKSLGIEI